jgi:hypothetical protein
MKPFLRMLVIFSALGITVSLSGCGGLSDYEQKRFENLNSAVDEFDVESISEVVCNVEGGEVGLHVGFTRSIVFAGADSWQAIADRLQNLGYTGVTQTPFLTMARDDGLFVSGRLIAEPGSEPDLEEELLDKGCNIPPDGAVSIQFEERQGD